MTTTQLTFDDAMTAPAPTTRRTARTSADALERIRKSGKATGQRRTILLSLDWDETRCAEYEHDGTPIEAGPGLTRPELARDCALPLQSVCGRVRELLDLGWAEEKGTRRPEGRQDSHKVVHITQAGRDALRMGEGEGG